MSKVSEYRASAAECRRKADSAKDSLEKHMWRDMSESWLGMMGHAQQEDFAAEERQRGTRQSRSNCLH